MNSWSAPVAAGPVDATVTVPGSKSLTNRALVLAALADSPSALNGVLRSRDTDLMIDALRALGTRIEPASGHTARAATDFVVTPGPLTGTRIDCGLAGTIMRFLPPVAALAEGVSEFTGDDGARVRPQSTVLGALRDLGVEVEGDRIPFKVTGTGAVAGGRVEIDAGASSQFVSGLLLSAARFTDGLEIVHTGSGAVPSGPHIDMTVTMLRESGVDVASPDPTSWHVRPGSIEPVDRVIEPDLSNATPFLAAAAATGGTVRIPHWPMRTTQPGDAIRGLLERMGATVRLEPADNPAGHGATTSGTLTVTGPGRLYAVEEDLGEVGELTPTVAALCALADGTSTLSGVAHLRGHETDRIAALATELTKIGCAVTETEDGLVIEPPQRPRTGQGPVEWGAYADHRMATAGAIVGLRTTRIEIDDIDTTSKTMPGFEAMWTGMLSESR